MRLPKSNKGKERDCNAITEYMDTMQNYSKPCYIWFLQSKNYKVLIKIRITTESIPYLNINQICLCHKRPRKS